MEFPNIWFGLSAVLGIVFWVFIFWLAWMLVSSVRGIHTELRHIREVLNERLDRVGG